MALMKSRRPSRLTLGLETEASSIRMNSSSPARPPRAPRQTPRPADDYSRFREDSLFRDLRRAVAIVDARGDHHSQGASGSAEFVGLLVATRRSVNPNVAIKATVDFGTNFLYFPTQEMARFAPFCRSVDAHLYAQWIHRLGCAVVEVSPPLYARQNGLVTLLCDRADHPDLLRRPRMNPRDTASVVSCPSGPGLQFGNRPARLITRQRD